MKKTKLILPLLLFALTLGGCKNDGKPTVSSSVGEDVTSTSTGEITTSEGSEVATSIDMEAQGYNKSEGWPKEVIDTYLSGREIVERLPDFSTTKETYYAQYEDIFVFQQEIVEVAIFDTTMETTTALHDVLVAAGWSNSSNLEEKYIQFFNFEQSIAVMGGIYAGDETFPAMTMFYVAGFVKTEPLEGFTTHEGWPTEVINDYLTSFGVTDVIVPALEVSGETHSLLVEDDPYFDPYIALIVPGANRVEEYKGILAAGGFTWEADEYDPDYFYALNATENVMVEFFFGEKEGDYPAGMYIFISALGSQSGGGEVADPSNPDSAIVINLRDESNMVGERNGKKTTWQNGDLKMEVTKNTSTVNVGNLDPSQPDKHYYSNPLRVYAGQLVTFTAAASIEQVHLEFDASYTNSLENIKQSVPAGATYQVKGGVVVIQPNGDTNTFTLEAALQFRLFSITVYFK